jgi:NAD(P)-dependent dehydrogenase (short-subunit alcohol dehydrogenase family)
MRENRWGRILNIIVDFDTLNILINEKYGYILGEYPFPFAVGKAGRRSLTDHLARAEMRNGITINNILPGIIEEMSFEAALSAPSNEDALTKPSHVAEVAVALCEDTFRFVTGSDVVIPGNIYSRIR